MRRQPGPAPTPPPPPPLPCGTQSMVRLSVVIPAYNEESRLPGTLQQSLAYLEAQPYASEIIVADHGSTDDTPQFVRQQSSRLVPVRLIMHPDRTNHGKGAAVRLGMSEA